MRRALTTPLLLAMAALTTTVACGGGSTTSTPSQLQGTVTVSAATSLRSAFTQIGDDFSVAHPGLEVTFNFDSSSTLSTQILEGVPVDVYASADAATMTELTDAGLLADGPAIFARNELVIVTEPDNPSGVTALADLADLAEVGVISLCGEDVPCGRYAAQVLANAGTAIPESRVTRGQNVGATLAAVADGDAVAGIVYVTDARSAGDAVEVVTIPTEVNVLATYPIGVLERSANPEAAAAFMRYVLGAEGRAVLDAHGFLAPS